MILHNAVRFFRKLFSVQKSSGNSSLDLLQSAIDYRFSDSALLKQALTHKSGVGHEDRMGLLSNERMEFLGDAVLNCLVTEHLYRLYPEKPEGQLSKVKSLVVSRKILGTLALTIDLGKYLIFGNSEKKTGGVQRNSIVSNAFEAMIGAIYLDGGLDAARHFLQRYLFCRIDDFVSDSDNVNYKSRILELSQRDGFGFPKYTVVSASGPDHAKEFDVHIEIGGVVLGHGTGTNKKIAQQNAARAAMDVYCKETILSSIKGEKDNELVSH